MSRKDFISDHLVDMRKHLRDSYENFHNEKAARNAVSGTEPVPENKTASPASSVPAAEPEPSAPAAGKYLPEIRSVKTADEREWRELEGRIIHDISAVDSRRNILQQQLAELEKFAAVLDDCRQQIGNNDISGVLQKYFAARGHWSAFETAISGNRSANEAAPASDCRGMLWVAGAVIAGSLTVALVLVGLFS